jgi:hypothetical protein
MALWIVVRSGKKRKEEEMRGKRGKKGKKEERRGKKADLL